MKQKIKQLIKDYISCPYCEKKLTAKSFENGKGWICEHCRALLTREKFIEFYKGNINI